MSDWQEVLLGDIADILTGHPFKSQYYTQDTQDPRLVGGDNIAQGFLRWDNVRRWPRSRPEGLDAFWLQPGDVVLAMDRPWIDAGLKRGAMGREDLPALLVQRTARLRGSDKLDTVFLRYIIGSRNFTQYVIGVQTGTAIPHISPSQIKGYRFLLPPLSEQKAIASILGALDDKIELNRRMNATLEAMAQTLFQSWFVDFDPVRAKLDGRPPLGLAPAVAELFPSRFGHSEQPIAPEGWQRTRWGDVATLEYGKSLRDYRESHGLYRVYGTNGPIGFHREPLCNSEGIVIGRKGAYRGIHFSPEPFYVIDTAFYLKPKNRINLRWAYYELLQFDLNSMDSGSAIPSTSRDDFYGIPVLCPPAKIQDEFGQIVESWSATAVSNDKQSRTLANLRDTLLPKLLSGELSVKNLESQVAAVV